MPEPETISNSLKGLIRPHLKERLLEEDWQYLDDLLEYGVFTITEDGVSLVTIEPLEEGLPAMQFSTITGEYVELTDWDYILEYVNPTISDAEDITIAALKHYHKVEFQLVTDYHKVYDNRSTLTVNNITLYKYDCVGQTIYLKEDNYPITYDKQLVTNDEYMYNFTDITPSSTTEVDLYTHRVPLEWKRTTNIWR